MSQTPSVGRVVHYVSHGTPVRPDGTQEYRSQCRAAIVTEAQQDGDMVSLAVLNPEGMFFNRLVKHHNGAETQGAPDCPNAEFHGHPHRYCQCGWMEASYAGGTWHWPERV